MLYMQLTISAASLAAAWLIGSKNVWGQRLSVVAHPLWWIYIVMSRQWGLIPLEVGYTVIVARALILWERDEKRRRSSFKP